MGKFKPPIFSNLGLVEPINPKVIKNKNEVKKKSLIGFTNAARLPLLYSNVRKPGFKKRYFMVLKNFESK
jgi:hypothetical protein